MPRKNSADSFWFRFYPDKYLGGTAGFTFEMHGAYLIILLHQWNKGPFSEKEARSMVGDLWDKISFKFVFTDSGYLNVRMHEESEHKRKISKLRTNAVQNRYNCSTIVVQPSSSFISSSHDHENTKLEENNKLVDPKDNINVVNLMQKTEEMLRTKKIMEEPNWIEKTINQPQSR